MIIILSALAVVACIIAYFIILMPLIPLLKLKVQLGDKAILKFYPLQGLNKIFMDSLNQQHDLMKGINDSFKKNPKAVVILTNYLYKPFLVFTSPEYIKKTYLEHQNYQRIDPFNMELLLTNGLLISEGDQWKRQRKFLGTAFTFEKLTSRLPMMNQVVQSVAQTDKKDNLNRFMSRITGEVVIKSFFGELAQGLEFEGKAAQIALVEMMAEIGQQPFLNPFILIKQILFKEKSWSILPTKKEKELLQGVQNFNALVKQMIEKRINELRGQTINQENMIFLDLYVTEYLKNENEKNKININEVIEQFITLFFAGTDTTATTCGTCLYFLAKYPEIQKEILEEVQQVVGNQEVKEEHLNKLVRINALIQEVLRLKNPAFMTLWRNVKQDLQLLDIKLKKGWVISQFQNASSIQEHHFDNAEEFNYKRWLEKKDIVKNDTGFIHIPFAAGPRNCIGQHMALMEAKIILAILVRKYQIELNPKVEQIKFGMKFLYCVEPDDCLLYKERN